MVFRYSVEKTRQANSKIADGGAELAAAFEKILAGIQEHKEGMQSPGINEARSNLLDLLLEKKPVIDGIGKIASSFVEASEQAGRAFGPAEEQNKDVWNKTPDDWRNRQLPELPADTPAVPDTFIDPNQPQDPPQQ